MSTGKKHYKAARSSLIDLGFTLARANGETEFYEHPQLPQQVKIFYGMGDTQAGHLIENVSKRLGVPAKPALRKRNANAVKERQARDRERAEVEASRLQDELDALIAQRESRMDGLGRVLSNRELNAIERQIEATYRERRYWQSLMSEVPAPNSHNGHARARHVAGERAS